MKISFKEYKTHIILAIVAAILVPYLFEPILNLLGKAFIYIGNSVASQYLDSLYKDIAAGRTDYFLVTLSGFYVSAAITFFIMPFIVHTIKSKKHSGQKKEINDSDVQPFSDSEKAKIKKSPSFSKFIFYIVSIIFSLVLLGIAISSTIKYSTINSFEQRIKILSPYITTNEKDLLISKFSTMNSYNDYIAINDQIIALAKAKNIMLPKQSYISLY